jgi:hypothetical protein
MMFVGLKYVSKDVDEVMPVRMLLIANDRLSEDRKLFESGITAAWFEPDLCMRLYCTEPLRRGLS